MFVLPSIGLQNTVDSFVTSFDVTLTLRVERGTKRMSDLEVLVDRGDDFIGELGSPVRSKYTWKSTDIKKDIFDEKFCPCLSIILLDRFHPAIS